MTATPSTRRAQAPGVYHRRGSCRACEGDRLRMFLSLGPQPLANAFLPSSASFAAEEAYPLDVFICEQCSLVQVLDVIDPEVLFGHYVYVTGTSETIAQHNVAYAHAVCDELRLGSSDLVVEVASNDGSLLACFSPRGVRTLGVEPARNIAEIARGRGVPTVSRFFHSAAARELRKEHGAARVVIGNNVLAHVDDTRDFLAGAAHFITDDGRVVVEVPYAQDMLDRWEYDTVYHEHLCYFSVTALAHLGERAGLGLVRVDRVPVHGGSVRAWYAKGTGTSSAVRELIRQESATGLTSLDAWERFGAATAAHRLALRALLERLRDEGRTVAGYGAPAKGNTLLNYCGIDTSLVAYTVDRNALKVGSFTPGMHLPVLPVATLLERQPDYVLILAWNFADEIIRQLHSYQERGGRFILPIPSPRIL